MIIGKHLVAGNWIGSDASFTSSPAHGPSHAFTVGTPDLVDQACQAAEEAFWSYGYSSPEARAKFLHTIDDEVDARGEAITEIGTQETGLPDARLNGERGRTVGQLRLFAEHILKGEYLDAHHDAALPDRAPLPRPGEQGIRGIDRTDHGVVRDVHGTAQVIDLNIRPGPLHIGRGHRKSIHADMPRHRRG